MCAPTPVQWTRAKALQSLQQGVMLGKTDLASEFSPIEMEMYNVKVCIRIYTPSPQKKVWLWMQALIRGMGDWMKRAP